ncbi:hypothetical protein HBN61_22050 [Pseudomonas sp. WS 5071]|nr:hypothetical protein [Pseudomonas sp. WS 5071]
MAKRTRYYAVVSGKPTGIFNTWDGSAANARRPIKTVCSLPVTGKGFPKESPNKPSVMRESPQHLIRAAHEPDELFRL